MLKIKIIIKVKKVYLDVVNVLLNVDGTGFEFNLGDE